MFERLFHRRNTTFKSKTSNSEPNNKQPLPHNINQATAEIQAAMGNSADLQVHKFTLSAHYDCAVIYLKSFSDIEELNKSVLTPLIQCESPPSDMPNLAKTLPQAGTREVTSIQDSCRALAQGEILLLVSGFKSALTIPLKKVGQRQVDEPEGEKVVRGPRDGFVESLWSNVGILRQKIKNPNLRVEVVTLGTLTLTEVGIVYLEGIANPKIVEEVRRRVKRIDIDRILAVIMSMNLLPTLPGHPFLPLRLPKGPTAWPITF